EVKLQERFYLSTSLLEAAELFANRATAIETVPREGMSLPARQQAHDECRGCAIAAVLCAAAYVEARINEFLSDLADSPDDAPSGFSREASRALGVLWNDEHSLRIEPLEKYDLALRVPGFAAFDRGLSP